MTILDLYSTYLRQHYLCLICTQSILTELCKDAYEPGAKALSNKEYTGMFVGYYNPQGFSDYSLDGSCPHEANRTFYAAFQRNKARDEDPPLNVTAIFCRPAYYQQLVNATVDTMTLEPLVVQPIGEKETLPENIFNATWLEELINGGVVMNDIIGDALPTRRSPKYMETLAETNVSITTGGSGGALVHPMVGMAVAVGERPLEDYLDWGVLAQSYGDAYQLMFASAMKEVLNTVAFNSSDKITGQTRASTEAVLLEPVFVYIVEGLLGAVSLATSVLLCLLILRSRCLQFNPSTIAAVMSLVSDDQRLVSDFQDLDCCTADRLKSVISHRRYKLINDGYRSR
jgi:hypothetical protein